mmetsp:Transcript_3403/g.8826  ORF Transcript_3403/g.8826 Transcript_3403/m.8826 type:complete len:142 (-) Transcript_3403:1612-2037(-)
MSGEMSKYLKEDSEWMTAFNTLFAHKLDCICHGKLRQWIQPACDELGPWCEEQRNMYCNLASLLRLAQQNDQDDVASNILLSEVNMLRGIGLCGVRPRFHQVGLQMSGKNHSMTYGQVCWPKEAHSYQIQPNLDFGQRNKG